MHANKHVVSTVQSLEVKAMPSVSYFGLRLGFGYVQHMIGLELFGGNLLLPYD